jgi:hypothetical protein
MEKAYPRDEHTKKKNELTISNSLGIPAIITRRSGPTCQPLKPFGQPEININLKK